MLKQFSPFDVLGRANPNAQGEFLLLTAPSVLHDTYVEHTRRGYPGQFEVIVIDDGSKDDTMTRPAAPELSAIRGGIFYETA